MHVLILPSWYPREPDDYSGSFFREQAIALAEAGVKVGVLAFVRHSRGRLIEHPAYLLGQLQRTCDAGVDTWRVHYGAWSGVARVMTYYLQKRYYRHYCLQEGPPDLLHAHCAIDGGTRAKRLAQQSGLPYVLTEHASAFAENIYTHAQLERARAVYAAARKNIAVSEAVSRQIHATGISFPNHVVIPNMISPLIEDAAWPPPTRQKTDAFHFLCVGSLNPRKRHHILLSAFASGFRGQSVYLTIAGTGPLQQQLQALCEELHIADQVRFSGHLTREQVLEEVDACDALVLTSASETFGVVLIEAHARGKPVIATDCGGPRTIVTPENGFLVPPNCVEALEAAMLRMVRERRRFVPEMIRAQCLKIYGRHVVCSSIMGLYEDVLGTRSR